LTANGASSEGIAYIAARINGIALPRDKEAQRLEGVEVPLQYDAETGLLLFENFETGDLVFFKSAVDPEKAGEMGIVVGYGQVLMSRNSKASMKILDLDAEETLKKSVMTVRRIF
jgi:cell wall-associated NlpC family hydrolase